MSLTSLRRLVQSESGDTTAEVPRQWLPALALLVLGVLSSGTGIYFMVLRPPYLPEDARFTGVTSAEVPESLLRWLAIVFRTWGGFVFGMALCFLGLSAFLFSRRRFWLRIGVGSGVLFAFGSFLVSNIQLHSDFLWFVSLLFAVALASAALLFTRRR